MQHGTAVVKAPERNLFERRDVLAVVCGAGVYDGGVEIDDAGGDVLA